MTRVPNFRPFIGDHCETVATGNLLKHAGLSLSEPMLFGLGSGLAFGVFDFKNMPAPFIGGRTKAEEITKHLTQNLGIEVEYRQTRSKKKAWDNLASFIDAGVPVGVKVDCYFLDYFSADFHFAGHYVAVHGYDEDQVFVIDTAQQGSDLKTARDRFEEGRLWKGPMSSNALTWTLKAPTGEIDWPKVLRKAISTNAMSYLTPPIKNFGATGIRKAAKLIPSWKDTVEDASVQFALMGSLMERGGTGGGLFRRIYRDFLIEANEHLHSDTIAHASDLIGEASENWTKSATLLEQVKEHPDVLNKVAEIFLSNAELEERAFKLLRSCAENV